MTSKKKLHIIKKMQEKLAKQDKLNTNAETAQTPEITVSQVDDPLNQEEPEDDDFDFFGEDFI